MTVYVLVKTEDEHVSAVRDSIRQIISEATSVVQVTGQYNLLVTLKVRSYWYLSFLITNRVETLPGVFETLTHIQVESTGG